MNKNKSYKNMKYRDPEDLTDSEEDVHPNISARSYHSFIREERKKRLKELNTKQNLTKEEEKEKDLLIYKTLPIAKEVGETSFVICNETTSKNVDYSDHLLYFIEHNEIADVIKILDDYNINLEIFEEIVYLHLITVIKEGNNELGYILCKIGLLIQWARTHGRKYLCKLKEMSNLDDIFLNHYKDSVEAIKKLNVE